MFLKAQESCDYVENEYKQQIPNDRLGEHSFPHNMCTPYETDRGLISLIY